MQNKHPINMDMPEPMTEEETALIEDYLKARPELGKWYAHQSKAINRMKDRDKARKFIDRNMPMMTDLILQVLAQNEDSSKYGRSFLDMNDGEALAYAVGCAGAKMETIRNPRLPSMNAEEALCFTKHYRPSGNLLDNINTYFKTLCARMDGKPFDSDEVADHAHMVLANCWAPDIPENFWYDEDALVQTSCKYEGVAMFKSLLEDEDLNRKYSDRSIDCDYLNRVLLAPRPTPNEIDGDVWHSMAVRLVDETEKRRQENPGDTVSFGFCMEPALLGFLNDDQNDLTFLETVYDLVEAVGCSDDGRVHHLVGPLDPETFDMLRKYGVSFAAPLLESRLV